MSAYFILLCSAVIFSKKLGKRIGMYCLLKVGGIFGLPQAGANLYDVYR